MRINIGGRRVITVSKPFLNVFHGGMVFQKERCTSMPQIMESNVSQSIFFEQQVEM